MRLRLDKLVLSAGLALAMVATTIPVGAAYSGNVVKGTTAVTEANIRTAVGVEATGSTTNSDKLTTTIADATVDGAELSGTHTFSAHSDITKYLNQEGLTLVDDTVNKYSAITVEQSTTYGYVDEYTLTSGDIESEAVKTTTKNARKTAALKVVNDAAGSNATATVTGGKKVTVVEAAATVVQADPEAIAVGNKLTTTISDANVATKTVTWTITDLGALGYSIAGSYDVTALDEDSTAYDYVVVKLVGSAEDGYTGSEVVSEYSSKDHEVTFDITEIGEDVEYILTKKTKSVAGALLFDDGEADSEDAISKNAVAIAGSTLTYSIRNLADDSEAATSAKEVLDSVLDGYTHAAYFDVTLSEGNNLPTGVTATVRIKKPQDIIDANAGKTITWKVTSKHGNQPRTWTVTEDGDYLVIAVNEFSTFELSYTTSAAETPAEDPTTEAPANEDTQAPATTPEAAKDTTTKSDTGVKSGDNSMMPLFMTTLLLALCAGSLAIYKEKKTN